MQQIRGQQGQQSTSGLCTSSQLSALPVPVHNCKRRFTAVPSGERDIPVPYNKVCSLKRRDGGA